MDYRVHRHYRSRGTPAWIGAAGAGLLALVLSAACGSPPAATLASTPVAAPTPVVALPTPAVPTVTGADAGGLTQPSIGLGSAITMSDPSLPAQSQPLQLAASRYITHMDQRASLQDVDTQPGFSILGDMGMRGFQAMRTRGTAFRIVFAYYHKNDDPRSVEPEASVGGAVDMTDNSLYYFMADCHFKNNQWLIFQFNFM